MDLILDQSSEDLLCCRVCLMTDCKLFNIHEYKLADAFSRVSGTPVVKGRLPQYLCSYCHTQLLKCARFRLMCLRTERCLKQELFKGKLNTDLIRTIDRTAYQLVQLIVTDVENVDFPAKSVSQSNDVVGRDEPKIERVAKGEDTDDEGGVDINEAADYDDIDTNADILNKYQEKEPSVQKNLQEKEFSLQKILQDKEPNAQINLQAIVPSVQIILQAKETVAINKDKVGIIKQNIDKVASNINNAENVRNIDKVNMQEISINTVNTNSPVRKTNLRMELEILKGELEIRVVKDGTNIPTMEAIETEMINNDDQENEVSETISLRSMKRKIRLTQKGTGNNTKERKVQVDNFQTSEDMFDSLDISSGDVFKEINTKYEHIDSEQFEKDCDVKIITLSKEEQLEEIALRKQSTNYLESRYKCEDCGKGFGTVSTYNNHRRRHSPSAGDAVCEICALRFHRHKRRRSHQFSHQTKFVCRTCNYVSRSRTNARAHHAMHQGKIFICPYCAKIYRKPSTYVNHVRTAHPSAHVACELCGETFIGERGLRAHCQLMHKHAENQKPQPQHKCTVCPASFVSSDALTTHAELGEHTARACEQCGESCAGEEALRAHARERHPPEARRCEECRMTFCNGAAFDVHYRRKHLNERAPQPPEWRGRVRYKPMQPFMCDQCGRVLKLQSAAQLRAHMDKHRGLLPLRTFACPQCPKTFAAKHLLNTHVRLHSGEKPFHCELCPVAFAAKYNLKRHYKLVHLGEHENAVCPVCARVCTTRAGLRVHVRAVHERRGWPKRNRNRAGATRKRTREDSPPDETRQPSEATSDRADSPPPTLQGECTRGAVGSDASETTPSPPPPPPHRQTRFRL